MIFYSHKTRSLAQCNTKAPQNLFIYCISLIAVLTGIPQSLQAAELAADNLEEFFENDTEVVLTASRLLQSKTSSPSAVTVIDREMIRLSGARSVVDILLLVPGFQVARHTNGGPTASYQGVSYRHNNQLQLLIDGRPTYVPLRGGIVWSELPLAVSDIERVEVVRSPNAATFGPNSFSAVVNIKTVEPTAEEKTEIYTNVGGNKFASTTVTKSGRMEALDYRLSLQVEKDEGFSNIVDRERSNLAYLSTTSQISNTKKFFLATGTINGGHIEDESVSSVYFYPYEKVTNSFLQFGWENAFSTDNTSKFQYYYNRHKVGNRTIIPFDAVAVTGDENLQGVVINADFNKDSMATRHEIEYTHTKRLSEQLRYAVGAATRSDTVRGFWLFGDTETRSFNTFRLSAHGEYQYKNRLTLNVGSLVEENTLSGLTTSPRVSLNFAATRNTHWRLGYTRGIRSPLPYEIDGLITYDAQTNTGMDLRAISYIGNPDLKPEKSDVTHLGFLYYNASKQISLDTTYSYKDITDIIGVAPNQAFPQDTFDGRARLVENRDNISFHSLEIELGFKPTDRSNLKFNYSGAFDIKHRRPLNPPKHTLSLFASHRTESGLQLSTEYYYTSDFYWADIASEERTKPAKMNRLDLRVGIPFRLFTADAIFHVQGELAIGENISYIPRNEVSSWLFAGINLELR